MILWQMEVLKIETEYLVMSMVTNTMQVFNSCSNPIIYVLRTATFRKVLINIVKRSRDNNLAVPCAIGGRVDVF
jgi:hypothetical protein